MHKYAYNIDHEMVKSTVGKWCKIEDVQQLQSELEAANHDYIELTKERTDYVAENTQLKEHLAEEYNRGFKDGLKEAAEIVKNI